MTTASTKRSTVSAGKFPAPSTLLASVTLSMPVLPMDVETQDKYAIKSPRRGYITGVFGTPDIAEGDLFTSGGVTYTVKAVGKITEPVIYTEVILELVK